MVKLSKTRIDLENARLEQAIFKQYHETVATVAAATSTTLNIANGNVFKLLQSVDIVGLVVLNASASGNTTSIKIIRIKDNSENPRAIAWPNSFLWAGNAEPVLTQTSGAVDVISALTIDGGVTWYAFPLGLDMS